MAIAIFGQDQNQVALMYESGTAFATASGTGVWPGFVQSHDIDADFGYKKRPLRYAGGGDRDVSAFVDKDTVYTGTLSYYPQDWRMMKFAFGKCADSGSPSPYVHTITASETTNVNGETGESLPSFTLEDAQQTLIAGSGKNIIRTIKGCVVDTFSISSSDGEPITCEVNYLAKDVDFSSGAVTAVSESTNTVFNHGDAKLSVPSGTSLTTLKDWTFTINNSLGPSNYSDGSRDANFPTPGPREYELSATVNLETARGKALYDQYMMGGSTFNAILNFQLGNAGSNDCSIIMSGCEMMGAGLPIAIEGATELAMTIKPQAANVIANDATQYWNHGSLAGTI